MIDSDPPLRLPLAPTNPGRGHGDRGLRARRHRQEGAGGIRQAAEVLGCPHTAGRGRHGHHLRLCDTGSLAEEPRLEQRQDRRGGPGDDQ